MRVAIADDHGIFRSSLARSLTDLGSSVEVSAATGDELIARLAATQIDVAIVDVAMPPTRTNEGVLVARRLKELYPELGVLLLSAETATPQAVDVLREFDTGIGYLRKDEVADAEELNDALARLVAGERVIGGSIVTRLLRAPGQDDAVQRLSNQEREVLRLMAEGYSNAGISRKLHLAGRTVEDHVSRVFSKLRIGAIPGNDDSDANDTNKRVLAVLTWLRMTTPR